MEGNFIKLLIAALLLTVSVQQNIFLDNKDIFIAGFSLNQPDTLIAGTMAAITCIFGPCQQFLIESNKPTSGKALVAFTQTPTNGKIIMFGHDSFTVNYLSYLSTGTASSTQWNNWMTLTNNFVTWSTGKSRTNLKFLRVRGTTTVSSISGNDVLIWSQDNLPQDRCDAIEAHINNGGTLVAGWTAWAAGFPLDLSCMQQIFKKFGATYIDNYYYSLTVASMIATSSPLSIDELYTQFSNIQFPTSTSAALTQLNQVLLENKIELNTFVNYQQFFPGQVASSIPRITSSINVVKPQISDQAWISTFLYAPPGEIVTLTISNAAFTGFIARIGAHSDDLNSLATISRFGVISKQYPLINGVNQIKSQFGGLIYIQALSNAPNGTVFNIDISGACQAAGYNLATDTWYTPSLDQSPPYGELLGQNQGAVLQTSIIMTIDKDIAKNSVQFWDKMIVSHYDLLNIGEFKKHRFVFDIQISLGWMHSGYPVMCQLPSQPDYVNWNMIANNPNINDDFGWGFYHEVGHNLQKSQWTFSGAGEVTNNLFSLYSEEVTRNVPTMSHSWLYTTSNIKAKNDFLASNSTKTWNDLKNNPVLGLFMIKQLVDGFGWGMLKTHFATYVYNSTTNGWTDQQKLDQWVLQYSQITQKDLTYYFQQWKMPITASIVSQVQGLQYPVWNVNSCLDYPGYFFNQGTCVITCPSPSVGVLSLDNNNGGNICYSSCLNGKFVDANNNCSASSSSLVEQQSSTQQKKNLKRAQQAYNQ